MQFLSAARAPNVNQSCREMTRLISDVKLNHDKHVEDYFPDQQFQKAFHMQIGLSQGLYRSKRCFSSFQRSTFFGADIPVNITKQFRN